MKRAVQGSRLRGLVRVAVCGVLAQACASHHDHDDRGGPAPEPTAGRSGDDDADSNVGARAIAVLDAIGEDAEGSLEPLSGRAEFRVTPSGVDVQLMLRGCATGGGYTVFIQQGMDCSEATLLGPHWDSPRGEGIGGVICIGQTMLGRTAYSRLARDDKPWSIGGETSSDLLGHAFVLFDADSSQPAACGEIVRAEDEPPAPDGAVVAVGVKSRAVVSGLCLGKMFTRSNTQDCPNPEELERCASEHCSLDACTQQCSDYLACLEGESDPCANAFSCPIGDACSVCHNSVVSCALNFCAEQLTCAAPITPGGPCSQLEACCAMQGERAASCLEQVRLLAKFSGDMSCFGAMNDWDTQNHLPVPCNFDL